uniref:Uncharacterized protein n=1 Tax=Ditylenchus dipsaci TaxID=166011 RepID=A0A915EEM0_9BILA
MSKQNLQLDQGQRKQEPTQSDSQIAHQTEGKEKYVSENKLLTQVPSPHIPAIKNILSLEASEADDVIQLEQPTKPEFQDFWKNELTELIDFGLRFTIHKILQDQNNVIVLWNNHAKQAADLALEQNFKTTDFNYIDSELQSMNLSIEDSLKTMSNTNRMCLRTAF